MVSIWFSYGFDRFLCSFARSAQLGYDWSALQAASSAAAGMADDMTKWSP